MGLKLKYLWERKLDVKYSKIILNLKLVLAQIGILFIDIQIILYYYECKDKNLL